jgi:hypothetical protein
MELFADDTTISAFWTTYFEVQTKLETASDKWMLISGVKWTLWL